MEMDRVKAEVVTSCDEEDRVIVGEFLFTELATAWIEVNGFDLLKKIIKEKETQKPALKRQKTTF